MTAERPSRERGIEPVEDKSGANEKKVEAKDGEKKPFDIAEAKQDYVKLRVDWEMAGVEYDRLIRESGEAVDRLVSDPGNVEAKVAFWKVQEQLDAAGAKKGALADRMRGVADDLIGAEGDGIGALKEALSLANKELVRKPEFLIAQSETYAELGLDRLAAAFQRSNELQRRAEKLRERHEELKKERNELHERLRAESGGGKKARTDVLQAILADFRESDTALAKLTDDMEEVTEELRASTRDLEDLG